MKNRFEFRLWGRYALFTDPITKLGGEKFSYQIPTYEALIGVAKSIYWKPTIMWVIDKLRVIKPIQTQAKSMKPLLWNEPGNDLAIYNYLYDVEYQVQMHFEWNLHRPNLTNDRVDGKHFSIATRALKRGGRQDIFLGTRECQAYVEPCAFGSGVGAYDEINEISFGLMFHGFDYPDETGVEKLYARFSKPVMKNGVIEFVKPQDCTMKKFIKDMLAKEFKTDENLLNAHAEGVTYGLDS